MTGARPDFALKRTLGIGLVASGALVLAIRR
jgi:hypothetical protein